MQQLSSKNLHKLVHSQQDLGDGICHSSGATSSPLAVIKVTDLNYYGLAKMFLENATLNLEVEASQFKPWGQLSDKSAIPSPLFKRFIHSLQINLEFDNSGISHPGYIGPGTFFWLLEISQPPISTSMMKKSGRSRPTPLITM